MGRGEVRVGGDIAGGAGIASGWARCRVGLGWRALDLFDLLHLLDLGDRWDRSNMWDRWDRSNKCNRSNM